MEARPSGWYEDPQDTDLLRYWDGVMWTEHTALRRPPAGRTVGQAPLHTSAPGSLGEPGPSWAGTSGPQDSTAWAGNGGVDTGRSRAASGAWQGMGKMAPDGREYGSWLRRVGAFLIDQLVIALIALPFVLGPMSDAMPAWEGWVAEVMRAAESGSAQVPVMPVGLVSALATISFTSALIRLAYDVIGAATWGATLGKMLFGLRVRAAAGHGRLGWAGAIRRTILKYLNSLLGGIPLISFLAAGWTGASYLWPIWDPQRRALHDKFGGSEVVRVRAGDTTW